MELGRIILIYQIPEFGKQILLGTHPKPQPLNYGRFQGLNKTTRNVSCVHNINYNISWKLPTFQLLQKKITLNNLRQFSTTLIQQKSATAPPRELPD